MVNISGNNVAESNDPATVLAENWLPSRRLIKGNGGLTVIAQEFNPGPRLLYIDSNGEVAFLETESEKYLSTDANGNLIWR